jgi:putative ATP-dependent endonuclease of OLD family
VSHGRGQGQTVIPLVPADQLEEFIKDREGEAGERLRTLADRLGIKDKSFSAITAGTPDIVSLIVAASSGSVPEGTDDSKKKEWKKHGALWFKTLDGGEELAEKVFSFNLWPKLQPQILPFINQVRVAVGLPPISTVS